MIKLHVKIPLTSYRKLIYAQTYRRFGTIAITVIGILNLLGCILNFIGPLKGFLTDPAINFMIGVTMTFVLPVSIHYSTGRTYAVNKYLQEESRWTINEEGIKIDAQTFSTQYEWAFIHKVSRANNMVMIFHDGTVANFIPFDSFESYEDFEQFWRYLKDNRVRVA